MRRRCRKNSPGVRRVRTRERKEIKSSKNTGKIQILGVRRVTRGRKKERARESLSREG